MPNVRLTTLLMLRATRDAVYDGVQTGNQTSRKMRCSPGASLTSLPPSRAVQEAEVAVPADADDVDEEDAVVQGDECEVDGLDGGPDVVVAGEGGGVVLAQLLLGAGALEDGHGGEEDADEGGGEDELVAGDAGDGLGGPALEDDVAGEELEPGGGGGAEDDAAVEGHAAGAGEVVALGAALLDGLLGDDVAGGEEDGGGDALREEGARGQAGLVPFERCQLRGSGWVLGCEGQIVVSVTHQARTIFAEVWRY